MNDITVPYVSGLSSYAATNPGDGTWGTFEMANESGVSGGTHTIHTIIITYDQTYCRWFFDAQEGGDGGWEFRGYGGSDPNDPTGDYLNNMETLPDAVDADGGFVALSNCQYSNFSVDAAGAPRPIAPISGAESNGTKPCNCSRNPKNS